MSEKDLTPVQPASTPPNPANNTPVPDLDERIHQREQVMGNLMDSLKPWLLEFGNWIFGGLIAFNLVIVAPLLTMGPVHTEIVLAIALLAFALPLDVAGLIALKLTRDMNDMAIDEVMTQAFKDANITPMYTQADATADKATMSKRRTDSSLRYSLRVAGVSGLLTMLGMVAALWFIATWIAVLFVIIVVISVYMTLRMVTRLVRPSTDEEREIQRQYFEQQRKKQRNAGR